MRQKKVSINGKTVTVSELRVRELRDVVFPKLSSSFEALDDKDDVTSIVDLITVKIAEIIPGVTEEDIEEAYPSEVEALVEAFIDVNFAGLKKILPPILSFASMGTRK